MKQIISIFKAVLTDKIERKEFVGGFACVVVVLAVLYVVIAICH